MQEVKKDFVIELTITCILAKTQQNIKAAGRDGTSTTEREVHRCCTFFRIGTSN